jgi:SAM-dependent methyltransferase
MKVLNIGCGTKTSDDPDVVNLDWSMYLVIKSNPLLSRIAKVFLDTERRRRLDSLPDSIFVHDLRKGLPFPDNSIDAAYHSHFLEHLDRPIAGVFLREIRRVLRPGGIQRIVVPDMEKLCRDYVHHIDACGLQPAAVSCHDRYIGEIIEQMVRRESYGSSQKRPLRRWIERTLLGDARKRGETHQWMYDRFNLAHVLEQAGYSGVQVESYRSSRIAGWAAYGLDMHGDGLEYKPGSLYIEAVK